MSVAKDREEAEWLIGAVINVVTSRDESIDGEVYAYDPVTASLVLSLCA